MLNVNGDEIVISGISGRFPEADNIYEFWDALVNGDDLTTSDDRRWPVGFMGVPTRCGNVKNIEKFDATFFETDDNSADSTDPQLRMLYEVVYETIIDAGIIPQELKGSNTALILGLCFIDTSSLIINNVTNEDNKLPLYMRNTPAIVSKFFEFTGPTFEIDSACATSFSALFEGIQLMKSGMSDKLIIAGTSLHLALDKALMYSNLKLSSPDGKCKPLDASANGFCRSEAIAAILIEKEKDAKRIYATIHEIQINIDGFTPEGITFPNGLTQTNLMRCAIQNSELDPLTVNYIECHIAGTAAGDPIESQSILNAYRNKNGKQIMYGCLKSNIGHTEEVSGIAALTKVALIFQKHCIPPNRNYSTPNANIPALITGQIVPVLQKTCFNDELISINSFGIGGVNTHMIVKANVKVVNEDSFSIIENFPRLVNISGRTVEGLEYAMNWIDCNRKKVTKEFLALLNDISKTPLETGMYCRAFMLFGKENVLQKKVFKAEKRWPIWFIFPGLGSQWKGMVKEFEFHPVFFNSLEKCANVLQKVGVNLWPLLQNESTDVEVNIISALVSIVSIQIALVDLLCYIGIKAEGIIGYSIGEIAAAYADGCISLEEAVLTSYYTAKCTYECRRELGAMVLVRLSWEQALSKCPENVTPACDDSVDCTTIAGSKIAVLNFVAQLSDINVFAKVINSCEMAYHCPLAASSFDYLKQSLENVIKNPKVKSSKMISTSTNMVHVKCDATYFASNIVTPVMFNEAASNIPQNACIVEVGPSSNLLSLFKRSILSSSNITLMKKDCHSNVENILSAIGQIYCTGNNVKIEKLYPKVQYPVPRETLSLSHLLKWDHKKSYFVANYTHKDSNIKARDTKIVEIMSKEWNFIHGHCIDGRNLFPATGYLYLVWSQYAALKTGDSTFTFPVEFRDVMFKQAVVIAESGKCVFHIEINEITGRFTVVENGSLCITGYIGFAKDNYSYNFNAKESNTYTLKQEEIYRELRIRGYDYGISFQLLQEVNADGNYGKVKWTGNWITFLDSVLQLSIFSSKERLLNIPTSMEYFYCNPDIIYKSIEYQSDFDVAFDENIKQINSKGICIKGLQVTPIQRRTESKTAILLHQCFAPYNLTLETATEQKDLAEEFFGKCIILFEKLRLQKYIVTPQEEFCSFNVDSNEVYSFYKRLIRALKQRESIEQFFKTLTKTEMKILVFEANYKHMLIVQLKQIMENTTKKLFIVEVNETESKLKESVTKAVENYFMNYEYCLAQTEKHNNQTSLNVNNEVNLIIYKDVSTELIMDEKLLKNKTDMSKLLKSFEKSIKDNGFLLLVYRTKLTSLERKLFTLRNLPYPEMSNEENVINSMPKCFNLIGKRSDDFGVVSCIFKKLSTPKLPVFIKPQYDRYDWVENIKSALKEEKQNIIWLLAKESEFHGVIGLTRCLKKEPGGEKLRCFVSDEENVPEFVLRNDLIMNYFKNGNHGVYIHQEFVESKKDVEHSHLDIKTKGDLSSFRWVESSHNYLHEKKLNLINVYYSALNFKDVLIASGRIPHNAYPPKWHNEGNFGCEYSGIDSKGNKIMGITKVNAIATTIVAKHNDLCWRIPHNWSLEQAATVPMVYITVYYALFTRGKLKQNEKVLIHAGSGGVGQAAITVCLSMNCEIFTSVGTEEKKQFLKNRFPELQDNHFVRTRDLSFEEHILKVTGGKGVDLILNSLSEEKLNASINCLSEFGRFIEIGKYDIIQNNSLDSSLFQQNQSFHSICVAHLLADFFAGNKTKYNKIYDLIQSGLMNKSIKPLTATVFNMTEIEKAFRYMASGKHIGKVLIKVRDEMTEIMPNPKYISSKPKTYCNSNKVYILFGGLGGLGLEVAVWLASRGAKKLVISSRRGIKNDYQRYIKNKIECFGVVIKIVVNDASTYEKTRNIINEALAMGPIGGIFNLAMVLKDALMSDQTPELFENVCTPKINATLYADQICRTMSLNLDYFVCFSSLASGAGSAGQSNYGFANSVMESICEKRRNDGLHAVAIEYGPVGDTGAFNQVVKSNIVEYQGGLPQRIPSFLATLDECMNSNYAICGSAMLAPNSNNFTDTNRYFLKTVCHILGVDDWSKLEDNMCLEHLGMDSLMAVEVKQSFEREYNIVISTQEVRKLTIKMVKNLSDNRQK